MRIVDAVADTAARGAHVLDSINAWVNHWANWASVLGLLVGLVGFSITIWQVRRSKKAADAAAESAARVKAAFLKYDVVADFSSVIAAMEEIKRLHRAQAWAILPDRYAILRQRLITIRTSKPPVGEAGEIALLEVITQLSAMEKQVEKFLDTNTGLPKTPKLNEALSATIDDLTALLASMRWNSGE